MTLARLLGESNPFPLIRIPWDRDQPWQAVFLHEVAHNIQADLGLWVENRQALIERLVTVQCAPLAVSVFGCWHKEIFADLAALLLGGPAVAWGLAEFLSHPHDKVMTYRPGGPHPVGYLRVLILSEMLNRMGFAGEGQQLARIWRALYPLKRGHRIPKIILSEAPKAIPAIIDEIVYQPRRSLSERTLARVIPFTAADQERIRAGGRSLAGGRTPADLPPRFLVSACRYAMEAGGDITQMSTNVTARLAGRAVAAPKVISPGPSLHQARRELSLRPDGENRRPHRHADRGVIASGRALTGRCSGDFLDAHLHAHSGLRQHVHQCIEAELLDPDPKPRSRNTLPLLRCTFARGLNAPASLQEQLSPRFGLAADQLLGKFAVLST